MQFLCKCSRKRNNKHSRPRGVDNVGNRIPTLHGNQKKYCVPCSMGTLLLLVATPLGRERECKKTVVVFCCCHNGHFGHSGSRGVEKMLLHHCVATNAITRSIKTISGSLIFAKVKFVAWAQDHTPTMVCSENDGFAKQYSCGCSKNASANFDRTTAIYIR